MLTRPPYNLTHFAKLTHDLHSRKSVQFLFWEIRNVDTFEY